MGFIVSNDGNTRFTAWDTESRDTVTSRAANVGLPFRPIAKASTYTDEASGATYSEWWWGCSLLGEDGRCTDYENRPELCRKYQPMQDALCVEFKGIPMVTV